ncbi:MAG: DUF3047 domain-containing protein [Deltaproteobacteria bacterium]|nr:DUF3047 domain-containing protein [Deltaproteobacteria bacterium]
MFILEAVSKNVFQWKKEEINIITDYEKACDKLPPFMASIAIMNDSDSTEET